MGNFSILDWRGSMKYVVINVNSSVPNRTKVFRKDVQFGNDIERFSNKSSYCEPQEYQDYMLQLSRKSVKIPIHNLEHFTDYKMTLKACNEKGCGINSHGRITFKTDEFVPDCSPPNVILQNISSTLLVAQWDRIPSVCSNGIVIGYNLTLRRTKTGDTIKKTVTSFIESVLFEDLGKYEYFCVKIAGVTSKGAGKYSEDICTRTSEDGKSFEKV